MFPILHTLAILVCDLFKSRRRLEAENLFLRHQLNVILRQSPTRFRMRDIDRLLLTWMVRLWANSLGMVQRWSSPNGGALASGRLQSVVALKVEELGQGDRRLVVTCAT